MNKNSIIAATTVAGLVMGGVMLLKSNNKREDIAPLNQSLVGNIHQQAKSYREKILEKSLPAKMTKTQAYKNFVDSKVTTDQFLKSSRVGQAKEFVKTSFAALKDCYKDGCGQAAAEEDGFYDPALSVAQQSLKRVLQITAKYPKELELQNWVSEDDLYDLLSAQNEGLRKAAFDNLVVLKGSGEAFAAILDRARDLEGDAAAQAIKNILSILDESNTQDLVDTIALINKDSSSATILGILENLEGLKVTSSQINQISEGLCRFKGSKAEAPNIAAMNYYIKSMATNSGIEIEATNYCL